MKLPIFILFALYTATATAGSWFDGPPGDEVEFTKEQKAQMDRLLRGIRPQLNPPVRKNTYTRPAPYQEPPRKSGYSRPYTAPKRKVTAVAPKKKAPTPRKRQLYYAGPTPAVAPGGRSYAVSGPPVDAYVTPAPEPEAAQKAVPWQLLMQDNEPLNSPRNRKKRLRLKQKRQKHRAKKGRVASRRSHNDLSTEVLKPKRMVEGASSQALFRMGVVGGMVGVQSGSSYVLSGTAPAVGTSNGVTIGVASELRRKYWAVELDGYFGLLSAADPGTSNVVHRGAFADFRLHAGFKLGSISILPQAGIGYAYSVASQAGLSSGGITTNGALSAHGAYGLLGIEVRPIRRFEIKADYAISLSANAARSVGGAQAQSGSGQFDRLRVGTYLLITPQYSFGLQYTTRSLGLTASGLTEFENQYLGVLRVKF